MSKIEGNYSGENSKVKIHTLEIASNLTGISVSRIEKYCELGFLETGLYSFEDMALIERIGILLELGINYEGIRRIIELEGINKVLVDELKVEKNLNKKYKIKRGTV